MSSVDNFEELSNAALRAKCKEYNLPDVPITDTSRKILIKKLRATIDGINGNDKKQKNRRETIHVTKIPTPVEQKKEEEEKIEPKTSRSNRRTTIAAATIALNDNDFVDKPGPLSSKRRSSRATPTPLPEPVPAPAANKRKTAVIEEESDEDDLILIEAVEQTERPKAVQKPDRPRAVPVSRASRSPSLTKSPTVTTSYKLDPVESDFVQKTELDSDFFSYDRSKPFAPSTAERETFRRTPPAVTKRISAEPEVTSTLNYRANVARTSVEPEPFKPSYSFSNRLSAVGGTSYSKDSPSRRYTTGLGYSTTTTTSSLSKPTRYTTYVENSDEQDDEEDITAEAPYFSDFARRLERLKTDQLNLSGNKPRDISIQREVPRYSSISGRKAPNPVANSSIRDSFRNFLIALDQKYKLRRNFVIFCILFVIVAIYVFFFHSVN